LSIAYLDTQVVVWLHEAKVRKLTIAAKREIERRDLLVSPMVFLEIDFLYRRRKVRHSAAKVYDSLRASIGVLLCDFPFPAIAMKAIECGWTDEPFDKIIVAHAWANDESLLITADQNIREHYARAVW
jgi:PIN domain nuclease of toxin-antitoxin system